MKRTIVIILSLFMLFQMSIPTMAAEGNVIYMGNAGKFIFAPGSEYSLTDLFSNFKDVMPGDTLTQKIVVKNDTTKSVKISMRALGGHENSKQFLSMMELYVENPFNVPLFEASADQTAQLTEWREVGVLASGGETEFIVGLKVSDELDNSEQQKVGYLDWEFMVEEIEDDVVKTGDRYAPWFWLLGMGCSTILFCTMLIAKKRKKESI